MTGPALAIGLLLLAGIAILVGTFRGSFRIWLVGYALVVAGLVAAYSQVRAPARSAPGVPTAPASREASP